MRDLFTTRHALRGEDYDDATRLLLRPTTPPDDFNDPRDSYYGDSIDLNTRCGATWCLHWVSTGEHAATDDFADTAFRTLAEVAATYAAAGYKTPLPDEGQEGDTRTDFYLTNLDSYGASGFCRSDGDGPVIGQAWYAYCGFDNDFANISRHGAADMLRIIIAHEYFHAVQFAYDTEDDGWLMESTASAVEDEVYDDINDNVRYLKYGQMGDPEVFPYPYAGPTMPLDTYQFTAYGNWTFWRHLTERHDEPTAGLSTLIRQTWEALDTTQGPNPSSSLQALERVLASRGITTPDAYLGFAVANQHPASAYSEGAAQSYLTAPNTLPTLQLARTEPTATRTATLDHLTSVTGAVLPFPGSRQLRVQVSVGNADVARAAVTVYTPQGPATRVVPLSRSGKGAVTVPFNPATVSSVEVTLANGSTAMTQCGGSTWFSCGGTGVHDDLAAEVRVQAVG